MKAFARLMMIAIGGLSIATAVSSPAQAACGIPDIKKPGAIKTASTSVADGPDIVGLWQFTFTSTGNEGLGIKDGAQLDMGYAQWHSDGTEIMNSGGRSPVTQNFCLGVWASTGALNYHLNHWALSYDTSGVLNAKVNIKEDVVLAAGGNHYSGPFTIDVYDPKTGGLLQHVAGTVDAGRLLPK